MLRNSVLALAFTLALAASAPASAADSAAPHCTSKRDGSGSCRGTIAGFKALAANAETNATFAQFVYDGTVGSFFSASIDFSDYVCQSTASMLPLFALAATMNDNLYFTVEWNHKGTCTSITFTNATYLK